METLTDDLRRLIGQALAEDVGAGDWTTRWCVASTARAEAEIAAKGDGVIAGLEVAAEVFRQIGGVEFRTRLADGDAVEPRTTVASLEGSASSILTGERTALNFLARLSGVATLTRRFVMAAAGTGARITDTRKTTPLWRDLERSAARAGGAVNHRRGLDAMVLIKENHLICAGGITAAVGLVRQANDRALRVEVETTNLDEVREALDADVDRIMLDNMPLEMVERAVALISEHPSPPEIEASGGVALDTVQAMAEAGVDYISVGALTHSAPALDLSLRIVRAFP